MKILLSFLLLLVCFAAPAGQTFYGLIRLNADGTTDATFNGTH